MLDKLIRENQITAEMGISVMNDSAYTYDISTKLIDMGEILFAARALELKETEREMALSENELDGIVDEIEGETSQGNPESIQTEG